MVSVYLNPVTDIKVILLLSVSNLWHAETDNPLNHIQSLSILCSVIKIGLVLYSLRALYNWDVIFLYRKYKGCQNAGIYFSLVGLTCHVLGLFLLVTSYNEAICPSDPREYNHILFFSLLPTWALSSYDRCMDVDPKG